MSTQTPLQISEANRRGADFANTVNAQLYEAEKRKLEVVYQLAFPEESPWAPVQLAHGMTCSPYRWEKLTARIKELRGSAGTTRLSR